MYYFTSETKLFLPEGHDTQHVESSSVIESFRREILYHPVRPTALTEYYNHYLQANNGINPI
jgi:hypothetical protein